MVQPRSCSTSMLVFICSQMFVASWLPNIFLAFALSELTLPIMQPWSAVVHTTLLACVAGSISCVIGAVWFSLDLLRNIQWLIACVLGMMLSFSTCSAALRYLAESYGRDVPYYGLILVICIVLVSSLPIGFLQAWQLTTVIRRAYRWPIVNASIWIAGWSIFLMAIWLVSD